MSKQPGQKIVIIGCGNLAWHLAKQLGSFKNVSINVYNHRPNAKLEAFKKQLKVNTFTSLKNIATDAHFYFICVDDKHILSSAKHIKPALKDAIVMHTSGSMPLSLLGNKNRAAVFYPLQTFSVDADVNWREIPVLIESDNKTVLSSVKKLAGQLSDTVLISGLKQRLNLHLAAVLVSNFPNALYTAAGQFLKQHHSKTSFNLLLPLIRQTTRKLETLSPREAQTGPAKRKDKAVMNKHTDLLKNNKELKKLYKELSNLIIQQQK